MNFRREWSWHHNHSDVMYVNATHLALFHTVLLLMQRRGSYWIIALPMMAILLPMFLWSTLR